MKTLDELDALWSEASDSGHGAAVFFNAIYAAWPEVRERLRRAEVVAKAAERHMRTAASVYQTFDALPGPDAREAEVAFLASEDDLRAALTEEPPHDDVNCASCAKVRATAHHRGAAPVMTPERAERERAELLAVYERQLESALVYRQKEWMRHRRTGRHLEAWYREVLKARNAIRHIRALRSTALDEARRERDAQEGAARLLAEAQRKACAERDALRVALDEATAAIEVSAEGDALRDRLRALLPEPGQ